MQKTKGVKENQKREKKDFEKNKKREKKNLKDIKRRKRKTQKKEKEREEETERELKKERERESHYEFFLSFPLFFPHLSSFFLILLLNSFSFFFEYLNKMKLLN